MTFAENTLRRALKQAATELETAVAELRACGKNKEADLLFQAAKRHRKTLEDTSEGR